MKNKRILAFFIDIFIINVIIQLIGFLIKPDLTEYSFETENYKVISRMSYDFIFYLVYFLLFDFFREGITIGKKVTSLIIVNPKQTTIGRNNLVKRTMLKLLSIVFLPISGVIYLIFDKTLHDDILGLKVSISDI